MSSSSYRSGPLPKHWLKRFVNKYTLVVVLAGGWLIFFDGYNLRSQWQRRNVLSQLQQECAHYTAAIEAARTKLNRLQTDPLELERIARERYHFKRPNEDLFLLVKADRRPE